MLIFLHECLSRTLVIYSCGLSCPPHVIKKLFGCTCVTHWPSIPLPSPLFPPLVSGIFSTILLTGGELSRHNTDDTPLFCQGHCGEAPRRFLSPVTPFSFERLFSPGCADCVDAVQAIAEGGICSAAMLIQW